MAAESLQNKPCGGRYGDIVQSIGHTPLIELKRLSPKPGVRIWAKLESRNPTGSVKDRVARALIEDAEDKGLIGPHQTILEPTSGNTGISLAMICGRKGYNLKVVMPENVTPERTQLLEMYGAEIVYSEGSKGSNGAVEMALDMAGRDASYYMPYQYGNQANPEAHYNGTALEILEELDEVSAFVAGLGTGGTLMGNGRRLKEELGESVKIVAAEPMQGEPVQGLRSLDDGFIPPIIDLSLLDRKILRHQPRCHRLDAQAARRGAAVRGCVLGCDRARRGPDRQRARRGQRRLHRVRRRLEVPVVGHLHAPGRGDREPGLHRLVVSPDGRASRRALLSGAGAALAGGTLAVAGCGSTDTGKQAVKKTSAPVRRQDIAILNQALALERRTVAAYIAGIPLLTKSERKAARQFLNEELQHTGELISLIKAAGSKAPPRADSYVLGHPTDGPGALALLHSLEGLQITSYLDWIPRLSPGPVRAAVSSILTVDAQHLAMVRVMQGQVPVPGPFVTGSV